MTKLLHRKKITNVTEPNIAAYGRNESELTSAPKRNHRMKEEAARVVEKSAVVRKARPSKSTCCIKRGCSSLKNALSKQDRNHRTGVHEHSCVARFRKR